MIKVIKISALVASILLASGIIFKSQHLLGANAIFTTGVVAGVIAAILMVSFLVGKPFSGLEKFNYIFSSLIVAIVMLSFLFKIMHWPGAAKLVWVADIGLVISGILFLVDSFREKDPTKSILKIMTMFYILFLLMLIVVSG